MSKTLKSEHNTKLKRINTVLINCWQINVAKGRKVNLPEHIHCMLSKNTNITTPLMRGNCLKDHFNKTCKGKICQIYSCRAHFALKQTFFNFQPFNLCKCQYELQIQDIIDLLFKFHTFYSCHQCHSNTIFFLNWLSQELFMAFPNIPPVGGWETWKIS